MGEPPAAREVLDFWFGTEQDSIAEHGKSLWFVKSAAIDAEIRRRFLSAYELGSAGQLGEWRTSALGNLALVVLLDQFPRNMFRGDARAFAADPLAREVAAQAITRGFDQELKALERVFLYLPFEHSESLADQQRSLALFAGLSEFAETREMLRYAQLHYDVVERFGRFPHRNAILGRESTAAEREFLAQPGSSF